MSRLSLAEVRSRQRHPHLSADPFYSRLVMRRISPYVTWAVFNFTPLSANAVTMVAILSGVVAALLFLWPFAPAYLIAVLLLQFAYLCDTSDGEVARLRGSASKRGTYYDLIGHILQDRTLYVVAAVLLMRITGFWGPVVFLMMVCVAFSEPFGINARAVVTGSYDAGDPIHGARRTTTKPAGLGPLQWGYYLYRRVAFIWNYPAAMNLFCLVALIDAARFAIQPGVEPLALPVMYAVFGSSRTVKQFANAVRLLKEADWSVK